LNKKSDPIPQFYIVHNAVKVSNKGHSYTIYYMLFYKKSQGKLFINKNAALYLVA